MRKILTTAVVFSCISLFNFPLAFCQDTTKRYDHNEDENDMSNVQHKKPHKAASLVAFGIEGGLNIADFVYGQDDNGDNITTDAVTGIRIGVLADIPIHGGFYLQPGLFYAMNGATNNYENYTWRVNTIEIPINIIFKFGQPNKFFIGGGPYIGYNISGNYSSDNGSGSLQIGSNENDNLKALDIGLGINAGYELQSGLFFRFRYQAGLSNMQPQSGADYPNINSESYGIQVGYFFGRQVKHKVASQEYPGRQSWH